MAGEAVRAGRKNDGKSVAAPSRVGTTKSTSPAGTGVLITEVRVRNYRCLESTSIRLEPLTLLIGQNNAGKTSFLSALHAAIGAGQRVIGPDDVHIKKGEPAAPKSRSVEIDILIRPVGADGNVTGVFPEGSPWLELWGSGITQDEEERDLAFIRTTCRWDAGRGEYVTERRFMRDWQRDPERASASKRVEKIGLIGAQQLEPLALYMLDAKRDIAEDMRSRSSFWHKLVESHGLEDAKVDEIERLLTDINKQIVGSSQVFTHIQSHLQEYHGTLSCDKDSVAINPLARSLRDLSKGMDVVLSTQNAPAFPLGQQGMGTRSLGTFFTFWAFTTWRQKLAKSGAVHPMMAMEEPEAHLHPQAQRALFRRIQAMPGQRIISTHSPYICSQCPVTLMRHFSKVGDTTSVSTLDLGSGADALKQEDLRKIDRHVLNTRGDMLFARAIVLFEGDTEEQAIPQYAEQYWTRHPYDLGISFIGVGGYGNYLPFLRLAQSFGIPWYIFSDGEDEATDAVDAALRKIGERALPHPRVRQVETFERAIVIEANREALIEAEVGRRTTATPEPARQRHAEAVREEWKKLPREEQLANLLAEIEKHKTEFGAILPRIVPPPKQLIDLFKLISSEVLTGPIGEG